MKKKLFALLMALVLVLSLAACGGDKGGDTQPSDGGAQSSGEAQPAGDADGEEGSHLNLGYDMNTDTNY